LAIAAEVHIISNCCARAPGNRGAFFRPPGATTLHRAAGFRMVGTLEAAGHKFGRWVDTVLMQRPLGAGATTQP
jgi:hypothetical protein